VNKEELAKSIERLAIKEDLRMDRENIKTYLEDN